MHLGGEGAGLNVVGEAQLAAEGEVARRSLPRVPLLLQHLGRRSGGPRRLGSPQVAAAVVAPVRPAALTQCHQFGELRSLKANRSASCICVSKWISGNGMGTIRL